jgi:hypothetical protein
MPDGRVGPRSCRVCGPGRVEGCWRCAATFGHRHLEVVDRHGRPAGSVAACGVHGPSLAPDTGRDASRAAEASTAIASTPRKRWLDRTYRQAVKQLRQEHTDEFASLLDAARSS